MTESGTILKYNQNSDNIQRVKLFHSLNMHCAHVCVHIREREWSKNKHISKSNSYMFISYSNAAWHFLSHILGTMWLWKLFARSCSHEALFFFSLSVFLVTVCMHVHVHVLCSVHIQCLFLHNCIDLYKDRVEENHYGPWCQRCLVHQITDGVVCECVHVRVCSRLFTYSVLHT